MKPCSLLPLCQAWPACGTGCPCSASLQVGGCRRGAGSRGQEECLGANLSQSASSRRVLCCRELSEYTEGPYCGHFAENRWPHPVNCGGQLPRWVGGRPQLLYFTARRIEEHMKYVHSSHFCWKLRLYSLFCGTFFYAKWTKNNDLTVGHQTESRPYHACSTLKMLPLKGAADLPAAFKNPFCARKMCMSN